MQTNRSTYDIVTVGGGLGGAGFAKLMAEEGARVLVLERSTEFRDRIRGEVLVPWGVADAKQLGFDTLLRPVGNDLNWWDLSVGGTTILHRDIPATCLPGLPVLTYYHPQMQEILLQAAEDAGAEIRRGATVTSVRPGTTPQVAFQHDAQSHDVQARLVVGADGRASAVRRWCGFEARRDPERRLFAGILFEDMSAPADILFSGFLPGAGLMTYVFPQGNGRVRSYVGFQKGTDVQRFQGAEDVPRFIETAIKLGVEKKFYDGATPAGPLATFDATDEWVPHPYRDGVALTGDAAATSDPTWGQGMSLAFRDMRLLRAELLATEDWEVAGNAYAAKHDEHHRHVHTADGWYTDLFLDIGPEADARRERALPLILQDFSRIPDTPLSGPECPATVEARRRFFGEDLPH
jgi:2-polyprenyl-6-methoxyphenol hydroxylase-like FAD-dependent oxidoreductase